jgi:molecular chaperone DnaK (HSP70)
MILGKCSGVSDVIGIDLGTTNSVVAMMRYGHVDVIASAEGL